MRSTFTAVALLVSAVGAAGQPPVTRFDLRYNPELYHQDTPAETLKSVLGAVDRNRHDYLTAHLIDPAFVDARLEATFQFHEKAAGEKIASTAAGRALRGEQLSIRLREVTTRLAFDRLLEQVRTTLDDDPTLVRDLRKMAREGEVAEAGETATISHKDVKDRTIHLKRIGGRWYLENRQAAAKE